MTAFSPLTDSHKRRSAHGAIRGYLYQFEKSALEILGAGEDDVARLEGVEDLDLLEGGKQTAVQIKYWESTARYSNKAIAEPLYDMFQSFLTDRSLRFRLYVYFGSDKSIPTRLTRQDVENAFESASVRSVMTPVSEELLSEFAETISIEPGLSIDDQREKLAEAIATNLKCDNDEALELYVPKAVHYLNALACNENESQRIVSKRALIAEIDRRQYYYGKWHAQYLTQEQFEKQLAQQLKKKQFGDHEKLRILGLRVTDSEIDVAADLLTHLSKHFENGYALTSHNPWTIVVKGESPDTFFQLKKKLLMRSSIMFNDGYESICFSPLRFMEPPIRVTKKRSNLIQNLSFSIRIVSIESFLKLSVEDRAELGKYSCWYDLQAPSDSSCPGNQVLVAGCTIESLANAFRKVLPK
ncbi:Uncharacterised protein [Corynebacterium imitans]|uniref:CD-NTase associated protein 4-like DNA endonuclease domain-containing protein n=1 Tax=Corynebacterium imitans TaxID=156978 RepID=A0A076NST7_9CORY|nr:hypothetical protein [Corynebacterium imitans]AIJ33982.1 hypothetical protein CIMIT_08740 [Corynebacterium imitans]SNV78040.1 Uncharacterised protein [Corynebacterium imitans]